MELFEERNHFIVQNGDHSLWCNRLDGSLTAKKGSDICSAWNPVCLGTILGLIGKIQIFPDSDYRLLFVRQHSLVGSLPGGIEVYKIQRIVLLPLNMEEPKDLDLEMCSKHHFGISRTQALSQFPGVEQRALQKTWNSIKSVAETVKLKKRENKGKEKLERKILEELNRMFSDSDSFFYCPTDDLTNSVQRRNAAMMRCHENGCQDTLAPWKRADDRFFWNQFMLRELIESQNPLADAWVVPVIQGYVQIENCHFDLLTADYLYDEDNQLDEEDDNRQRVSFKVCLISRRSRYRAGTRYKRRGIDQDGHCANYVETEQIVEFAQHAVSFVQVRGSVPLYWSQLGIKYKPAPRIEKGESENQTAFAVHFAQQVALYHDIAIVNLVDGVGKEKVIADAYLHHTLLLNSPRLTFIAFDFHEYCRGMHFENVSLLTDHILPLLKAMRYCWVDPDGMICEQRGVFRVNCIDCLDRTNIVQSVIARIVLETQCRKLGLLAPEQQLADNFRLIYQQMWANNGDIISRQYAGTAALKGDYTRTGERKFSGLMKDGVNSANRYYINRVKDVHRQATIDLLLGQPLPPELLNLGAVDGVDNSEGSGVEKEENLRTMMDECKKMLLPPEENCLGAWGLIDCDVQAHDPTQTDVDTILLLTPAGYYIANYDDNVDQVTSYLKVNLDDLVKIDIGAAPALWRSRHVCIRIHYRTDQPDTNFHTLRTTRVRLFNNIVINISSEEEETESLRAIAETLVAAKKLIEQDLPIVEGKLDRRRSNPHTGTVHIASEAQQQTLRRQAVMPQRGAQRLGQTLAGAFRNRLGMLRPTRLIPTVWYRNESVAIAAPSAVIDTDQSDGICDEETDLILLGERILRMREELLLESCGLVAVGSAKPRVVPECNKNEISVSMAQAETDSTKRRRAVSCEIPPSVNIMTIDTLSPPPPSDTSDKRDAASAAAAAAAPFAVVQKEEAPLCQLHMKTSFSEGSLGSLTNDLGSDHNDDDLNGSVPSALTRLRQRLPVLANSMPTGGSTLQALVAKNRLRSELRFRQCNTKVMLL